MAGRLVIVESPAKAKTIGRYLGKDFRVAASVGHIRDLPENEMAVDVAHGFQPQYVVKDGKEKVVAELRREAAQAKSVLLATDPDREGEAIAWHISELLGLIQGATNRIAFHEITASAVQAAVSAPRTIDMDLVDAQQARRVLDRLVGFELSELLWKKVKKGISGGRVQSVATRLVVDREREIGAFRPEEYWNLTAVLSKHGHKSTFRARHFGQVADTLAKSAARNVRKVRVEDKETADRVLAEAKANPFSVLSLRKGSKRPSPPPPFTTSTLQQEASRRLGLPSKRTMSLAQQLYEGVEVEGQGTVALVTYIRTDSVRISEEAVAEARRLIAATYGDRYVPSSPRRYANRNSAQDAHEAIRPSHFDLPPEAVRSSLTADQFRLYRLVWERFLASQMPPAEFDTVTADAVAGTQVFRAVGETLKFDGFLAAYGEKEVAKEDDAAEGEEEEGKERIPVLAEGEPLDLADLLKEQKFTQPPARYTEATLIKALEEKGIGRPSTYAPTISTILDREYVKKEKKFLFPTPLGTEVTVYLEGPFSDIVDVDFTADMEDRLDRVEQGEKDWKVLLGEFYPHFHDRIVSEKKKQDTGPVETPCPQCGEGVLVVKVGRFGKFRGCSRYPACRYIEKTAKAESEKAPPEPIGEKCPQCGEGDLFRKEGRNGAFIACGRYPECKYTRNIEEAAKGKCPKCGSGLLSKASRKYKGKRFFTCDQKGSDPACDFISWDLPIEGRTCPACGSYMVWRSFRGGKGYPKCGNRECPTNAKKSAETEGAATSPKAGTAPAKKGGRVAKGGRTSSSRRP